MSVSLTKICVRDRGTYMKDRERERDLFEEFGSHSDKSKLCRLEIQVRVDVRLGRAGQKMRNSGGVSMLQF